MHTRLRTRGASLIETMIAVGILGAISYFVVGMIRNGTVGQKALQVQDDARTMTENMAAILSDPVACAKSLVTVLPPVNPTVGTAVNAINDATGSAAYTTGNVYATKSLKLESIQVGGPGTDAKTGIQKWTPLGSPATSGTAFVQVVWSQVTPGGNSAGPVKLNRFFLINALSLNGANIATCVAQASGAGGGDSNWTKTSAGYIYNTNTGGVGIGTQTPVPTSVLDVYASTGHALLVSANGNVGIGTTSPASLLHVSGAAGSVTIQSTQSSVSASTSYLGLASTGVAQGWATGINMTLANGDFEIIDGVVSQSRVLVQKTTGNVGIGTTSPSYRLDVAGDVQATSFISTSDERLKTDVRPVEGLAKVLGLRGVRFRWRKDGTAGIGVIAQEVEKVFPELVSTAQSNGMKAVRYDSLLGPLIEAVKELYAMCRQALDLAAANQRRIAALETSASAKDAVILNLERRLEEQERALRELEGKPNASGTN